ncbi:MAG: hypothetical protein WC191_05970 [Proteiniphilum sp.]|nr:hypothetical protein [Proteiniphilum sp.]MDD5346402.1 hypothetical protein [Proteiniphilum sp.]
MKKGVAILLTMIILLTGIQPVLSLHLCKGDLFSVSLVEGGAPMSCCDMPETATPEKSPVFSTYHADCCDFQSLELSTDDFNHEVDQQNHRSQTPVTVPLWAVIQSLLHQVLPDEPQPLLQLYPPAGLGRLTTNLLTLICIYRL